MASRPAARVVHPWEPLPGAPYERHEILHYLRGENEYGNRNHIWRDSADNAYTCYDYVADGPNQLHQMSIEEAEKFCNKSVPIYIYPASSPCYYKRMLLLTALHNYTYRKWFRPYQSEIELNRFLTKVAIVNSSHLKTDTHSVINHALSLHEVIRVF